MKITFLEITDCGAVLHIDGMEDIVLFKGDAIVTEEAAIQFRNDPDLYPLEAK